MPTVFDVRAKYMSDPKENPWNSLEVTKLVASLMTPLLLFWLAQTTNESIRASDLARQAVAEKSRLAQEELAESQRKAEARQLAVQQFSKFIYERRSRASLLASALKRHSSQPIPESKTEVIERKKLYDEAYFNWNANHQSNLLLVRQILESGRYSRFEGMVEFRLVKNTFTPLDACLTEAYDAVIRDKDARPILEECKSGELIQRSLDCGYAITDELFKLSGGHASLDSAGSIVESRCP